MNYLQKMKGGGQSPPKVGLTEVFWSWTGSFLGIAAVSLIHYKMLDQTGLMMILGSFGASAVLIYGAIRSPLAQPRNLLGGHILSAVIGVTAFQWLGGQPWLATAVAVSTSIALMHLTKTLHPPGGATALIITGCKKEAVQRPNILFAIADDWGWPHASIYGDPVVQTPAFDRLAREGVLFNHAYISSPSCTPSRNAILTGQYHWRLGPATTDRSAHDGLDGRWSAPGRDRS